VGRGDQQEHGQSGSGIVGLGGAVGVGVISESMVGLDQGPLG